MRGNRTPEQNRALHLWFTRLSDALNDAGYDIRSTLREDIEIPWTPNLVKELLWRKIQIAVTEKTSTTELNKIEVSDVIEILSRHLGSKLGIHVPFPSEDEMQ